MSKANDFIEQIKFASESYLTSTFTQFKSIFGYSSSASQTLAKNLSAIKEVNDHSIVKAITEIRAYMMEYGNIDRRFYTDYIKPLLDGLASNPIDDLSESVKKSLQTLEFETAPSTNENQALLLNNLGYGKTSADRHPTLANDLSSPAGQHKWQQYLQKQSKGFSGVINPVQFIIQPFSVMRIFFQKNPNATATPLKLVNNEFHHSRHPYYDPDQGNSLLTMLFKNCAGTRLNHFFQSMRQSTPAIKAFFPSFLYCLVERNYDYANAMIEGETFEYERQARFLQNKNEIITSLKEMKRLGLETITPQQLHSIIKKDHSLFTQYQPDFPKLATAILSDETWENELLDANSEIRLNNILTTDDFRSLQSALKTAVPEIQPFRIFAPLKSCW